MSSESPTANGEQSGRDGLLARRHGCPIRTGQREPGLHDVAVPAGRIAAVVGEQQVFRIVSATERLRVQVVNRRGVASVNVDEAIGPEVDVVMAKMTPASRLL